MKKKFKWEKETKIPLIGRKAEKIFSMVRAAEKVHSGMMAKANSELKKAFPDFDCYDFEIDAENELIIIRRE